jgi:GT2 family glycosyltransferase
MPIDIVVLFYRNPDLVNRVFSSLSRCDSELAKLECRIIAVNDSPDDDELCGALQDAPGMLAQTPVSVKANARNLGFVRSANRVMARAVKDNHDVLLLNSDTVVFPGAVAEIVRVAKRDETIGFVSPRSNNADICNLPHQQAYRSLDAEEAHTAFLRLAPYLAEYQIVPTAGGFCLLIKCQVLKQCGLFDDSTYGRGYNEENDLIMRAKRSGYCAVLANHAFVHHLGHISFNSTSTPFEVLEERHSSRLDARHSDFRNSIHRYLDGARFTAEKMLVGLLPYRGGHLDLAFEISEEALENDESYEFVRKLLKFAVAEWRHRFHIHIVASDASRRQSELGMTPGVMAVVPGADKFFAATICIGHPVNRRELDRTARRAPVNIFVVPGADALGSPRWNTSDLNSNWNSAMAHADAVVYTTRQARRQFDLRFRKRPDLKESVIQSSLDVDDYSPEHVPEAQDRGYFLVIGDETGCSDLPVLASDLPDEKIVAITAADCPGSNTITYENGQLSSEMWDDLFRNARVVVVTVSYQGSGSAIVKALGYRKPVLAGSTPLTREIRDQLADKTNLHFYSSTGELVSMLRGNPPVWQCREAPAETEATHGWSSAAALLLAAVESAIEAHSLEGILLPRLEERFAEGEESSRIRAVEAELETRDQQISEIYDSMSWRITEPLRRIADWFRNASQRAE